jgi:hypothetical protein
MKIIEALKKTKELLKKVDGIKAKVKVYCANMSFETPTYPDQKKQVLEWLQSCYDIIREIARIRVAIQKTNLETQVTIELGGKSVTKSIAEWIHRRRELSALEKNVWEQLTDKGLREGQTKDSEGKTVDIKIVRYYAPTARDIKISELDSEPSIIDSKLEVINAITEKISAVICCDKQIIIQSMCRFKSDYIRAFGLWIYSSTGRAQTCYV